MTAVAAAYAEARRARDQTIVNARRFFTQREIAERTGLSLGRIKQIIARHRSEHPSTD